VPVLPKLIRFEKILFPTMLKRCFTAWVCVLSCLLYNSAGAQQLSPEAKKQIAQAEDSLVVLADSMYTAYIPDERPVYCEKFVKRLVRALKTPNSYEYDFPALQKKINIIAPTDKAFRIFNWLVVGTDEQVRYYAAIQKPSETLKLFPLVDYAKELGKFAEDSVLTGSKWYGALYYRIISTEVDGKRVYNLFGLNSSSRISNKKLIDPLQFTDEGIAFGAPVFNVSSENSQNRINRFILEYKKEVQASLNWDDELKMVYFDKLISQVNDPNRKYTYVPSGQYDGFRWEHNQWNYVQDLIPVQNFKDGEAPAPKPVKGKE
jgi:hypothetical protein